MTASSMASEILIEAESLPNHGGWKLDTQFIDIMGSPYLMAHGLGKPVADATGEFQADESGTYTVWVRTKNWVEKFAEHVDESKAPGTFQIAINGQTMEHVFGASGADWAWEKGGTVDLEKGKADIALRDLQGFNGRVDAIVLSKDANFQPDNTSETLPKWRREMLGVDGDPILKQYDIVFVGGGYGGSCGAISAARMGLKVALIQNRPVLGGNGSSEVRVWAKGKTPPGLYPLGDIVREFMDSASKSPGPYEEFEDAKKFNIVSAEENIDLFLNHHAFEVVKESDSQIKSVRAFDTRTSEIREFQADFFCDATGHGVIGLMAGADHTPVYDGVRMGMSNMWLWKLNDQPASFPETPWALDLSEDDFPYPRKFHAEWFWESGYFKDPLLDLEQIRDWNLVASFGAWNAIKNKGAFADYDETGAAHANAELEWMAYIGGTRETLQLLGDVILTEDEIVNKRPFEDGSVLSTWSIDLHYPREEYAKKFPDNPFISVAVHGKGVDRKRGYPVPYRCFYSRNIENLFMVGRNISVTHEALGTIRVMNTIGMMGVVVGKAASIAKKHGTNPRGVYQDHLPELVELMKLRGNYRRNSVDETPAIDPALPALEPVPELWIRPETLSGIVVDEADADLAGAWKHGTGLDGYVHEGYHFTRAASKDPKTVASATYTFTIPRTGDYELRFASQAHEGRSSKTPIQVNSDKETETVFVNQRLSPPLGRGFFGLGAFPFTEGKTYSVKITNENVDGLVSIDALQILPLKK